MSQTDSRISHPKTGVSTKRWDIGRMPNLHGKVAIVTGANASTGIGFHMAYQLALKGAKVYVGARSREKADNAIKDMKNMSTNSQLLDLNTFVADIGNLKQVAEAAKSFTSKENRLDILIHNAAILASNVRDTLNEHGISGTFTTNHLGPYTLTRELLPILKKTALSSPSNDVRVVVVASEGYRYVGQRRFRNIEDFNLTSESSHSTKELELLRYCYTKLANVLFAKQLQKIFNQDNVPSIAISLHPGHVVTAGAQTYYGEEGLKANRETMITVEEGALTALFAATDPLIREEKEKYYGAYLIPYGAIDEVSDTAKDPELARELWDSSEQVVAQILG